MYLKLKTGFFDGLRMTESIVKNDNEFELKKRIRKMSNDLEASVKKLKVMIKMFYCLRSK